MISININAMCKIIVRNIVFRRFVGTKFNFMYDDDVTLRYCAVLFYLPLPGILSCCRVKQLV
jgi:hypothetical protein